MRPQEYSDGSVSLIAVRHPGIVDSGGPFTVELELEVKRPLKEPILALTVSTIAGQAVVANTSATDGLDLQLEVGRNVLHVAYDELPAHPRHLRRQRRGRRGRSTARSAARLWGKASSRYACGAAISVPASSISTRRGAASIPWMPSAYADGQSRLSAQALPVRSRTAGERRPATSVCPVDVHREPEPGAFDSRLEREVVPIARPGNGRSERVSRHSRAKLVELDRDRARASRFEPEADGVPVPGRRIRNERLDHGAVARARRIRCHPNDVLARPLRHRESDSTRMVSRERPCSPKWRTPRRACRRRRHPER